MITTAAFERMVSRKLVAEEGWNYCRGYELPYPVPENAEIRGRKDWRPEHASYRVHGDGQHARALWRYPDPSVSLTESIVTATPGARAFIKEHGVKTAPQFGYCMGSELSDPVPAGLKIYGARIGKGVVGWTPSSITNGETLAHCRKPHALYRYLVQEVFCVWARATYEKDPGFLEPCASEEIALQAIREDADGQIAQSAQCDAFGDGRDAVDYNDVPEYLILRLIRVVRPKASIKVEVDLESVPIDCKNLPLDVRA